MVSKDKLLLSVCKRLGVMALFTSVQIAFKKYLFSLVRLQLCRRFI